MKNADELTKDKSDYCLAKDGEVYTVYLPEGRSTDILLTGGKYTVHWFNPRTGGALMPGTNISISERAWLLPEIRLKKTGKTGSA